MEGAIVVGAHAANVYMPPRHTNDADILVQTHHLSEVESRLKSAGWVKNRDLAFANAKLGLRGSSWHNDKTHEELDVIASQQSWVADAFEEQPVHNDNGTRVLPLPYLILMKLGSARTIDQGDLGRMLGRLNTSEIEEIITVIEGHYDDHQASEDIRKYAAIGQWEYQNIDQTKDGRK